ncbi:BLOC-1-related complex subunit 8 [Sesbania bispinosa]|nr:BLOC-1-related complex subunit 8 [Sesbania bispinosa]
MHGFSTVDGFVEISDCLADMIKYVANEPSVGLFYIQQHTQNAVPNVIKLKKNIIEKSHETTLHTEDLEDSVTLVRSMKECGFPIADEMIGDIKKSLVTMTTKQPKRRLIHQSTSNFQTERTSVWGNSEVYAQEGSEKRGNYFSSVFKFSKQKGSSLKLPQLDSEGSIDSTIEKPQLYPNVPLSVTSASTTTSSPGMESDKLPQSSQVEDESQPEQSDTSNIGNKLLSVSEKYDDFKASKEAKLEEWLEGTSNHDDNFRTDDKNRL